MKIIQTIRTSSAAQLCGAALRISTPGGRIVVSLHDAATVHTGQALRVVTIESGQIKPADQWTAVQWLPVKVEAGQELALAITAGDTTTSLAVAKVGYKDPVANAYVTQPAIEMGELSAVDAGGTVTKHAGVFLTLQLLQAQYTQATITQQLAEFDVEDATDFAVVAGIEKPEVGADVEFTLTLLSDPGPAAPRQFTVANAQRIDLGELYTGTVRLTATLKKGASMAPIIEAGTALLVGSMKTVADYVGTAFAMGGGNKLRVMHDASVPSGATVAVQYQPATADPITGPWTPVPYHSNSGQTAGFTTITHEVTGVAAPNIRLRLLLSGSPSARPAVRNLVGVAL